MNLYDMVPNSKHLLVKVVSGNKIASYGVFLETQNLAGSQMHHYEPFKQNLIKQIEEHQEELRSLIHGETENGDSELLRTLVFRANQHLEMRQLGFFTSKATLDELNSKLSHTDVSFNDTLELVI